MSYWLLYLLFYNTFCNLKPEGRSNTREALNTKYGIWFVAPNKKLEYSGPKTYHLVN